MLYKKSPDDKALNYFYGFLISYSLLILDEISMLSCKLFHQIEHVFRKMSGKAIWWCTGNDSITSIHVSLVCNKMRAGNTDEVFEPSSNKSIHIRPKKYMCVYGPPTNPKLWPRLNFFYMALFVPENYLSTLFLPSNAVFYV